MKNIKIILLFIFIFAGCSLQAPKNSEKQNSNLIPTSSFDESPLLRLPNVKLDNLKQVQKLTFASCSAQYLPQPIWKTMTAVNPDLHLNLGDNIYASRPEDRPLRRIYALQAAVPEYLEFRKQVPMLGTWDDHDFGLNDGGAENPEIETARKEFLEFFPNDKELLGQQKSGVYHSALIGPAKQQIQILILDTRTYRSPLEKNEHPKDKLDVYQPTQNKEKTLLGQEQWLWLESELKKPAKLRILLSSIQLLPEDHGFEKWMNFPHERGKLFELLKKMKIKNLLVLSGDRHHAEISQMMTPQKTQITEITSSGINKTSSLLAEVNRHRIGEKYNQENFGSLKIDWKKSKYLAEIIDLKGQSILKIENQF